MIRSTPQDSDSPTAMRACSPPSNMPVSAACKNFMIAEALRVAQPGGGLIGAAARSAGQTLTQFPSWICLSPDVVGGQ